MTDRMADRDGDLLARYADRRCEESFRALIERHGARVRAVALRQLDGDAHAAADVTQRVFVQLARQAPRLAAHPALVGWLHATAWRMCRELMRREGRRRRRERIAPPAGDCGDVAVPPGADPLEALAPWLDDLLGSLGERDRRAVLLRHAEHLPFAEVGRRLGLGENAARMRVERALERLRTRLAGLGVTSTAAAIGRVLGGDAGRISPWLAERCVGAALEAAPMAAVPVALLSIAASVQTKALVAGLAVAGIGIGLLWQHRTLERRDAEIAALHARVAALGTDLAAARDLDQAARAAARDAEQERAELVRLRGETARLRRELDAAMAAAAAGTGAPQPDPQAGSPPDLGAEFNLAMVRARIGADQTLLVSGSYLDPEGRRALVLVKPTVEEGADGRRMVRLLAWIAMVPPGLLVGSEGDGAAFRDAVAAGADGSGHGLLDGGTAVRFREFLERSQGLDVVAVPRVSVADGMQGRIRIDGRDGRGVLSLDFLPSVTSDGGSS